MHWNSSAWSQTPAPSPDSTQNLLFGVKALATNNVWAVGQAGISTVRLHWNGAKWSPVNNPNPAALGGYTEINTLRSIAGAAANDLSAVGNAGASTLCAPLERHWLECHADAEWPVTWDPLTG